MITISKNNTDIKPTAHFTDAWHGFCAEWVAGSKLIHPNNISCLQQIIELYRAGVIKITRAHRLT
jgi:hypothetical protein